MDTSLIVLIQFVLSIFTLLDADLVLIFVTTYESYKNEPGS